MDVSLDVNFRGPALGEAVFTKGGFAKDDIAKAMAANGAVKQTKQQKKKQQQQANLAAANKAD